ncbi:PREDICTED: heterogeneous nuclear ribonucleoprotein U-like protein 1 isoform X2 [Priapulus caudatus]|uniref:Heterogeneous nuclear ribonucleoprotein U-like protein 1 isoform X2 n=1 Tax=Priapulus caudatus TaxID=37621 RepID=A0ABM1DN53_PRICU|nr:PREDICTED: heterogeneous nuclear ribonucleoprotein U-like protein 1 isoform X2 [Priapulus caudatus]
MSDLQPKKMKVAELRVELQSRGLDTKGTKAVLVKRLEKFLGSSAAAMAEQADSSMNESGGDDIDTSQELDATQEESFVNVSASEAEPEKEVADEAPPKGEPEPEPEAEAPPSVVEPEAPLEVEKEIEKAEPLAAVEKEPEQEEPVEAEVQEDVADKKEEQSEVGQKEEHQQEEVVKKEEHEAAQEEVVKPGPVVEEKVESMETEVQAEKDTEEAPAEVEEAKEEEEFVVKEEIGETGDENMEADQNGDEVKKDVDENRVNEHQHGEKRKRSHSPRDHQKEKDHYQGKTEESTPVKEEPEEEIDPNLVVLDKYNSDLNLKINKGRYTAETLTLGGFGLMWGGARGTFGVRKGMVAFEVKITEHLKVTFAEEEQDPHVTRIGWSSDAASMQLGEEAFSYGYGGTGKASVDCKFKDYGQRFEAGDVITTCVNFDVSPISISYAKNGEDLGEAFTIEPAELGDHALFPHILCKNSAVDVNFGQKEEPFFPLPEGFKFIQDIPLEDRVRATAGPENKSDCTFLMMCGLPGSGKSYWVEQYLKEQKETKWTVLGTNTIIDKMRVNGLPRKRNYHGRWEALIDASTKCLNKLLELAQRERRNYILDQTNVYASAQRRKMRPFEGFKRKAIVIVPDDEEFKRRIIKRTKDEGKEVPDSAVLEMKANFTLPETGGFFDEIEFTELEKDEVVKLVNKYRDEGKAALPPDHKRGRFSDRDRGFSGNRDTRGGFRGRDDFRGRGGMRGGSGMFRGGRGGFNDRGNEYRGSPRGGGGFRGGFRGSSRGSSDTRRDRPVSNWKSDSSSSYGSRGNNSRDSYQSPYSSRGWQAKQPSQQSGQSSWGSGYGQGSYGHQGYGQSYGSQGYGQSQGYGSYGSQPSYGSGHGSGYGQQSHQASSYTTPSSYSSGDYSQQWQQYYAQQNSSQQYPQQQPQQQSYSGYYGSGSGSGSSSGYGGYSSYK